jgi:hypothetical protein
MDFGQFVRRPFTVDAVEITEENFEEVASLVGKIMTKDNLTFISLDRRIVPNVNRAFVGWWMTRLGDNYRCYSPKVFKEQFISYQESLAFSLGGVETPEEVQNIEATS